MHRSLLMVKYEHLVSSSRRDASQLRPDRTTAYRQQPYPLSDRDLAAAPRNAYWGHFGSAQCPQ